MTTNRLATPGAGTERIIPPDDAKTRVEFWIARGNDRLVQIGKPHLEWAWKDGSYFIQPRRDPPRLSAPDMKRIAAGDYE